MTQPTVEFAFTPAGLAACIDARWSLSVGDPSLAGWATAAGYGATALLCGVLAARRRGRADRLFWAAAALGLAALAANKQLDLQSALTAAGRCVSQMQGWYDDRRAVQAAVVSVSLGVAAMAAVWLLWRMRRALAATWPALLGGVFLMAYGAIRAAGFHHAAPPVGLDLDAAHVGLLEPAGIALIALNACWLLLRRR